MASKEPRTVYKYKLTITDRQVINIEGKKILHVGLDPSGTLCAWVEIPEGRRWFHPRPFFIVGTGNPIPHGATEFHGTVVMGQFVWHIYTEK